MSSEETEVNKFRKKNLETVPYFILILVFQWSSSLLSSLLNLMSRDEREQNNIFAQSTHFQKLRTILTFLN